MSLPINGNISAGKVTRRQFLAGLGVLGAGLTGLGATTVVYNLPTEEPTSPPKLNEAEEKRYLELMSKHLYTRKLPDTKEEQAEYLVLGEKRKVHHNFERSLLKARKFSFSMGVAASLVATAAGAALCLDAKIKNTKDTNKIPDDVKS